MKQKKYTPALGYDFLTAYYNLAIKITMPEKKFRKLLVEEVNPKPNEHILEFGFGTGQNLVLMHQENPDTKFEGLDIDPKVKSIAEHKLSKSKIQIPLHLYEGNTLPFADNTFDIVYSCLVFHQLDAETKQQCLNELNRVLKPNGKLIIADWGKAQNKLMRIAFGLVQLLDGFKTTNDNVKGLMPDFIKSAKFSDVKISQSINTAIGTFSYFIANKL